MKAKYTLLMLCCMISFVKVSSQSSGDVMSEKYRDIWNDQVQKKIDADIERNRKANAVLKFENLPRDTDIEVKQISHHFLFGGNISCSEIAVALRKTSSMKTPSGICSMPLPFHSIGGRWSR